MEESQGEGDETPRPHGFTVPSSGWQGLLFRLFAGNSQPVQILLNDIDVDIDRYFGCLEDVSKSVQVLLSDIEHLWY